ncbi:hypothetical protein R1flu_000355 [Riccia fluitans]|uniref:Uncharacterized protein n=1 Tax=Riccia fluitans TaxID=41844 RepID=A0ABD1Y0N9_9MARC
MVHIRSILSIAPTLNPTVEGQFFQTGMDDGVDRHYALSLALLIRSCESAEESQSQAGLAELSLLGAVGDKHLERHKNLCCSESHSFLKPSARILEPSTAFCRLMWEVNYSQAKKTIDVADR